MKRFLVILFLTICCYSHGFAGASPGKQELLEQFMVSKSDTNRLNTLVKLISITYQDPKEQIVYIKRLVEEAKEQKSDYYLCQGYLYHMMQAYNRYDRDEVNRWMQFLEPLALKGKFYDLYFRGKQCVIDMLLLNEQYEQEEREATKMLKEAEKLDNILGQMSAYHSLAHVYQRTYRQKEAFKALEKAIRLGAECNNLSRYNEVVRTMTLICENQRDYPNWHKYLKKQDSLITQMEKASPDESFAPERLMNCISFLRYHMRQQEWEAAAHYLKQVDANFSEQYDMVYKYNYRQVRYFYYLAIKDWDKALAETEQLLSLFKDVSDVEYRLYLANKADILNQIGRSREALAIYKQAKIIQDSLKISTINKQAEHLKNSYKADLQVLTAGQQQQRTQQLFLFLSVIIILILVLSAIHSFRVRHKLTKAEQEMRDMVAETEHANKIKERFLANINLTIRPPLEIIVSNSSRLALEDDINPAEKERLSELITGTSNQLMELINQILMLSKLEARMMKFNTSEVNIFGLVQSTVEAINLNEPGKIHADIPHEYEARIKADENYLKQVINSICNKPLYNNKDISLHFERTEKKLKIIFRNTILSTPNPSQGTVICNEINRMLVEESGGEYRQSTRENIPCIILTFNI